MFFKSLVGFSVYMYKEDRHRISTP